MADKTYKALLVEETEDKKYVRKLTELSVDSLPPGEVLVKVQYSSLNFKDALSASGNKGVTKQYPHTPGIDAAGVVEESSSPDFKAGEEVIVTSYDLGMNTSGGFGQYIRVPADWVVRRPENLTLRESMVYGTAGFTAALSVYRLTGYGVSPESGDVLVTGGTGGVGSIAVSILSKMGYSVTAVNGIVDETDYLKEIGAKSVISIEEATDTGQRPMLKVRWAGVIDTLGGDILSTAIRSTAPGGGITCCGNVTSPELPITVFPFILRGITLMGIDSQNCPMPLRQKVWDKIADEWKIPWLDRITSETPLTEVSDRIDKMLQGKSRGRTIVRLW